VARTGSNRIAKTLDHVHGQAAAVNGYEAERYAVRLTLGGNGRSGGLAEILSVRPVANDGGESIGRERGDVGCLDLRGDGAGFTKTVDGHPVRPRPEEA